ncbi:hypothetical protein N7476_007582 [Penicillium atrosanguineum]|uniref:Uncharacterized protein n=1 Tax=Penicillium atrosanguineum TaxID=1132637 RepID=A0A9W9U326_9EURO|nr:hypothetical protein N7476_007582 [Penicillium atrosanguineum]
MAPPKPFLHPLKTPKTTTMFPSELHDSPITSASATPDLIIKREDGSPSSGSARLTPPDSYTKFLEALTPTFSPVTPGAGFKRFNFEKRFEKRRPSPISVPSSASSDGPKTTGALLPSPPTMTSPKSATPQSARLAVPLRRLCIPPTCIYSPISDSPASARTIRSPFTPSDWKVIETPRSAGSGKPVRVRHVVTRTVTYKRTHLDPPPRGKRRKTSESGDT